YWQDGAATRQQQQKYNKPPTPHKYPPTSPSNGNEGYVDYFSSNASVPPPTYKAPTNRTPPPPIYPYTTKNLPSPYQPIPTSPYPPKSPQTPQAPFGTMSSREPLIHNSSSSKRQSNRLTIDAANLYRMSALSIKRARKSPLCRWSTVIIGLVIAII